MGKCNAIEGANRLNALGSALGFIRVLVGGKLRDHGCKPYWLAGWGSMHEREDQRDNLVSTARLHASLNQVIGAPRGRELSVKAKWHLHLLCACVPVLVALPANALDLSVGVSAGGMLAGAAPRFAVSPHLNVAWGTRSGLRLGLQDMASIVLAPDPGGVGVHNLVSAVLGYAWKSGSVSAGPSLSGYHMPACGPKWCAAIYGVSPGGRAYAEIFFAGPLGVSISAGVGWMAGNRVVPEGVSAMVAAGLVLRMQSEMPR